jgi:hypothetical protein
VIYSLFCALTKKADGGSNKASLGESVPSEDAGVRYEPEKESDFWPMSKIPDLAPEFIGRRGIDHGQKRVCLLRAESAFGVMAPSENILSF